MASFRDKSVQSYELSNNIDNLIELGDTNDYYAINKNDEYNINNDKPSGRANRIVQESNDYNYEENERFDAQDSNYERSASSKQFEHRTVEVFDDSLNKNIHEFDTNTEEDILIIPNNHNGNLPYHLEGTIERLSKQTPNPVKQSRKTVNVNVKFSELSNRGNEQPHLDNTLRIRRGALKIEASADRIIRFNRIEKFSSYRRNGEEHQNQKLYRESRQGSGDESGAKFDEVASASPDTSGQKCINKVISTTLIKHLLLFNL